MSETKSNSRTNFYFFIILIVVGIICTFTLMNYQKLDAIEDHQFTLLNSINEQEETIIYNRMLLQELISINEDQTTLIDSQRKLLFEINNKDTTPSEVASCEISDLAFLEEARVRFMENNEWDFDNDCSVLTNDFTETMINLGFDLYTVIGFEDDEGHKFNCVPFDVQTGIYKDAYDWNEYHFAKRYG